VSKLTSLQLALGVLRIRWQASFKTTVRTEKDILRLYELWIRTRSERAAKALQEAGVIPAESVKKDWQ